MTRIASAALLPLLALVSACSTPAPPPAAAPASTRDTILISAQMLALAEFGTDTVRNMPWREAIQLSGRLVLDPATAQPVGSIVEGRVVTVHVQPGDVVRRGQILVTLHSHEMLEARADLARARAARVEARGQVETAAAAVQRAERLLALRAGSQAEVERARAAKATADAMDGVARANETRAAELVHHLLGDGPEPPREDPHHVLIRARESGVVMARSVQPEQVVGIGAPLVVVGKPGSLMVRLDVPETALASATIGAGIRFTVPAFGPTRSFTATITRVTPMLDSLTRTAEVLARVDREATLLHAEQSLQAELLGPPGTTLPVVPAAAIQRLEGDTVVFTLEPRGQGALLEAVRVRVAHQSGTAAALASGLTAGRVVVTRGAALAKAELLKRTTAEE